MRNDADSRHFESTQCYDYMDPLNCKNRCRTQTFFRQQGYRRFPMNRRFLSNEFVPVSPAGCKYGILSVMKGHGYVIRWKRKNINIPNMIPTLGEILNFYT